MTNYGDAIEKYRESVREAELKAKQDWLNHYQKMQLHGPYSNPAGGNDAVCLSCETSWPCRVFNHLENYR